MKNLMVLLIFGLITITFGKNKIVEENLLSNIPQAADMTPYLQTSTPNSIYISWHSSSADESKVEFGTSSTLGQSNTGNVHKFNGSTWWHTVQLAGLQPNTEYFYKTVTGSDQSTVHRFRTQPANNDANARIRFLALGDTRSDPAKHLMVINGMKQKVIELYGADIHNQINVVMNSGDIVGSGGSLGAYTSEYFDPIAPLSPNLPFMISIGNHEGEHANFYNYMKYEDVGGSDGEKYYSFRSGPVLFISLNSNGCCRNNSQINWLTGILDQAQNDDEIHFIFVAAHHPGRSEMWVPGNTSWVQNSALPLLADYDKVEILLYGHSHNYERGAWPTGKVRLLLTGGGGSSLDRWHSNWEHADYPEIQRTYDYYTYSIFDIDCSKGEYTVNSYGFGNNYVSQDNELIDSWSRNRIMPGPKTPLALDAIHETSNTIRLTASPFSSGVSIMSSQFQITSTPGNYSSPVLDSQRDWENIYETRGAPNYEPVDKNDGIDLQRLSISSGLSQGNTYGWRIRYRDQNMNWSPWSSEGTFQLGSPIQAAEFTVDTVLATLGSKFNFTDLSTGNPTAWEWDFDNDGTIDSRDRDPLWSYTQIGTYDIKLTVTYSGNTSRTITKNGYVTVTPDNTNIGGVTDVGGIRLFPNPFRGETNLNFELGQPAKVEISIYGMNGKNVWQLNTGVLLSGKHSITWNGVGKNRQMLKAGQYIVKVKIGVQTIISKIIMLK